MKVLLTGHQGYLGTVMAPVLQEAGHEIVGLDIGWFTDCVLGDQPAEVPTLRKDIRDIELDDLTGFDAVVHLAALSNDPVGSLAPQITYDINQHASVRLARLAKRAGVQRFCYASTCSVYGASHHEAGETEGLVDETAELAPLTPYAISKVNVEAELAELADDDFSPTSLRNATAFGFSPRLRADIVLNNLVGHAVLSGEVLVMSDGTPWRPLVHAADIADAFAAVLAADRDAVGDRAFNVGDESNNLTVGQIAELVAEAVPGAKVRITGEHGNDPRSYRVDFAKIRAALPGFRCTRSIADGARELAEAYLRFGLDAEGFGQQFVRLEVLRRRQGAGQLDEALRWT
ncbi:MAG: SDR family oxidoreductase [Propionibacteriales bacterium]|nr:SDR family oxidoreductase [Propionibacteriales bacterium]